MGKMLLVISSAYSIVSLLDENEKKSYLIVLPQKPPHPLKKLS